MAVSVFSLQNQRQSLPAFGEWEVRPNDISFSGEFRLAREKRLGLEQEFCNNNLNVESLSKADPFISKPTFVRNNLGISKYSASMKVGSLHSGGPSIVIPKTAINFNTTLLERLGLDGFRSPVRRKEDKSCSVERERELTASRAVSQGQVKRRTESRGRQDSLERLFFGRRRPFSSSPRGIEERVESVRQRSHFGPAEGKENVKPPSRGRERGRSRDPKKVLIRDDNLPEKVKIPEIRIPRLNSLKMVSRPSSVAMSPNSRLPQFGVWEAKGGLSGANIAEKFEQLAEERRFRRQQSQPCLPEFELHEGNLPLEDAAIFPRSTSLSGISKRRLTKVPTFGHWETENEVLESAKETWASDVDSATEIEWKELLSIGKVSSTGEVKVMKQNSSLLHSNFIINLMSLLLSLQMRKQNRTSSVRCCFAPPSTND